ncbi:MAG: archaeosortase A [Halobacteriota archaeon]|nr:archaeosortase A [Halobacteriota archaeon]
MIEGVLWVAILCWLLSIILKNRVDDKVFGSAGWVFFSIYWLGTISYYLDIRDYFNVVLVCLMAGFCLLMAFFLVTYKGEKRDTLLLLTKATALTCLIYFPFANISMLNEYIIMVTAMITNAVLNLLGVPTSLSSPIISLGNLEVQIILACTAIESIALFTGVILSVKAPKDRKFKAFMASVPVIYALNIVRNVAVTTAYVNVWFETPAQSFYIAHHILAKIGSMFVLIGIAYAVFMILPEVLDMIEDTWLLFRGDKNAG